MNMLYPSTLEPHIGHMPKPVHPAIWRERQHYFIYLIEMVNALLPEKDGSPQQTLSALLQALRETQDQINHDNPQPTPPESAPDAKPLIPPVL